LLFTGISTGSVLFLLSGWISTNLFGTVELKRVLEIFSIGIPFSVLLASTIAGIRGFQKMKYKVTIIYQELNN